MGKESEEDEEDKDRVESVGERDLCVCEEIILESCLATVIDEVVRRHKNENCVLTVK